MQDRQDETRPVQSTPSQTTANAIPATEQNTDPINREQKGGAVLVVWQWLCYTLWAAVLIAIGVLLGITLAHFILSGYDSEGTIYIVAVLLCLLPSAILADRIYAKHEPDHKHGFQAVIMVIHAVFAFIAMLGSFITVIVTAISLVIDLGSTDEKLVAIGTAFVTGVLGLLFFIRVINPLKFRSVVKLFPWLITGITVIVLIAATAGPLVAAFKARTDRVIENNLSNLNEEIREYVRKEKKLPENLDQLSFEGSNKDAKILVEENLVQYKKLPVKETADDCKTNVMPLNSLDEQSLEDLPTAPSKPPYIDQCFYATGQAPQYSYELCVDWKRQKGSPDSYYSPKYEYEYDYINTYYHPAGEQCFKLAVYDYNVRGAQKKKTN